MCRGKGNDSVPDVEFGRTTAKEALIDDKSTGTLKNHHISQLFCNTFRIYAKKLILQESTYLGEKLVNCPHPCDSDIAAGTRSLRLSFPCSFSVHTSPLPVWSKLLFCAHLAPAELCVVPWIQVLLSDSSHRRKNAFLPEPTSCPISFAEPSCMILCPVKGSIRELPHQVRSDAALETSDSHSVLIACHNHLGA